MGRFNLLDEPWISVIVDEKGQTRNVSITELFENAHIYCSLGGDTKTQDFVVLRFLLAVLHTVFSRFDVNGEEYGYIELDNRMKPTRDKVDQDDVEEYSKDLERTWVDLWEKGKFPTITIEYLKKWRDHFYLFDDEFPFYQVTAEDIDPDKISKDKASSISGKNINRLISESGNKKALFSPKYEANMNKEFLKEAEIARWLLTFHGYAGLSDKVIFGKEKYKASKGWVFDLGGIYLGGENLFQTLLLNCALVHPKEEYREFQQKPCWEYSSDEQIISYFSYKEINNLAELYTNWSRAIYIDPETDVSKSFAFEVVKLPDLNHQDAFLEMMTLWRYNKSGDNKGTFTPRKHIVNQSMWRSFGLITISEDGESDDEKKRRPGIIDWINKISEIIENTNVTVHATSMQDDGNATSWVPTDQIYDTLSMNDVILTDEEENGWVPRIHEMVEKTKKVVEFTYKNFISDLKEIRNISSRQFVDEAVGDLYFIIDQPFRSWLSGIKPNDSKDEKIFEWQSILKKIATEQTQRIIEQAGSRDYLGIVKEDNKIKNIATAHNRFRYFLNRQLKTKGDNDDGRTQ